VGLGLYFLAVGVTHFIVPDGLPETLAWMYDLSDSAHYVAGTAEILGGIGLILPGLTRIRPDLTVWAAAGLIVIMVLAFGWHVTRSEYPNMVFNAILAGSLGFVAYGRWRLHPIPSRGEVAA
jgi:uncharacterized membrane protein